MAVLLGPPEIHQEPVIPAAAVADIAAADVAAPDRNYLDALLTDLDETVVLEKPPKGLTENFSPTFLSTGNPCLDFFFHVVPDTPPEILRERLQLAWDHDKLKALKLVCHLRGVRGTGKSDKEGFYTAALWLHKNHPKTLASNVASFAEFGCFKDLPEILFRLLEGADARKLEKSAWGNKKLQAEARLTVKLRNEKWQNHRRGNGKSKGKGNGGIRGRVGPNMFFLHFEVKKEIGGARWRKFLKSKGWSNSNPTREEKVIEKAKRVVERFNRDPDFKFLHEKISDVFARYLRSDLELLNSGNSKKISLAAKWCPSLNSSFDRTTLLCETIAKKVFPREEFPEYEGVEEAHYGYRVRDRLRKEVLVPLRKVLELPEVYIGANDWGSIPYDRVASVAMNFYRKKFFKHDEERFKEYLANVRSGKAKINAGALLPHEIIDALNEAYDSDSYDGYFDDDSNSDGSNSEDGDSDNPRSQAPDAAEVAELQWKRMVEDVARKGKLSNCIAVCDVSGSMSGIPMDVSVALGILVSDLSEEPWKGKVITFSEYPKLQFVEGESLREKTRFVRTMDWGMNTDFQKVFDLILAVAVKGKLKADQMIKRVFVFSDMEFDKASQNPWETDHEAIVRKFTENGYGECVPEIVFWNLRDSRSTPVAGNQAGVALVSGFSKNLMTVFLEEGRGALSPENVMDTAISGKEYQKLVVVD